MTDLTAEVTRTAGTTVGQPKSQQLLGPLVVDAPPEADELRADDERLPGWACAIIVTGLAALTWAVIIFAAVALLSR